MSDGVFTGLVLGVPFLVLTGIMLRTLDAPPEAVAAGQWSGGALLGLAVLLAVARVYARGRS